MRLNDLLPTTIQEGLRFGAQEVRQVEKMSKDILVGIEYEFFYFSSPQQLALQEFSESEYEDIIDDLDDLQSFSGGLIDITRAENLDNDGRSVFLSDILAHVWSIKDLPVYFDRMLNQFNPDEVRLVGEVIDRKDILNKFSIFDLFFDQNLDFSSYDKLKESIMRYLDERNGVFYNTILYDTLKKLDTYLNNLGISDTNRTKNQVLERLQERIIKVKSKSNEEFVIKSVTDDLRDHPKINYNDIRDVEIEPESSSEYVHVEVITKPQPIVDAIDTMGNMFEYITDNGFTSNLSGMHVNMSFKNLSFSKKTFNPIKLITLLDLAHIVGRTTKGVLAPGIFPPRLSVYDLFNEINTGRNVEKYVLQMALSNNFQEMEQRTLEWIDLDRKFQSINFQHVKEVVKNERRIEFRFFGGENYEDRFDEMRFQMLRTAYYMNAAFDPEFGRREYQSAFVRELNKLSESNFGLSFSGIIKEVSNFPPEAKKEVLNNRPINDYLISLIDLLKRN